MDVLVVYAHLVFGISLVGYAFYWTVMVLSLRCDFSAAETERLLEIAGHSRWPHAVVPWRLRLPLLYMGWLFLTILLMTGLVVGWDYGFVPLLVFKAVLVTIFAVIQVALTRRPGGPLALINFALAVLIVVVSGLLARS
jgi:hypothetical protein